MPSSYIIPRIWLAAKKNVTQTATDSSSQVAIPFQTILGGTMQSAWATATGVFTAPITGLIKITGSVFAESNSIVSDQSGYFSMEVKRSGSTIATLIESVPAFSDNSNYLTMTQTPNCCIAVTAGDALSFVVSWSESGMNSIVINTSSNIQIEYLQ